jgi:hypothetical protein
MDDMSINGTLASTTPVKEVQSRNSGGGDQHHSRNRKAVYNPEPTEEQSELPQNDSPHSLDEQA